MKTIRNLLKLIIGIAIIFTIVFIFLKVNVTNSLEKKQEVTEYYWGQFNITYLQTLELLPFLIQKAPQSIQYIDSLKAKQLYLSQIESNPLCCTDNFVYEQYQLNKYLLPLLNYYSANSYDSSSNIKELFDELLENIQKLNINIDHYNKSVKSFNQYYTTFPIFLIAKSLDFKRKEYFEVHYGKVNKSPNQKKQERRKWQKEIEKEHGLAE